MTNEDFDYQEILDKNKEQRKRAEVVLLSMIEQYPDSTFSELYGILFPQPEHGFTAEQFQRAYQDGVFEGKIQIGPAWGLSIADEGEQSMSNPDGTIDQT